MKPVVNATIVFLCMFVVIGVVPVLAQQSPEELSKESAEACMASASVKATPQMIVDKVNEAAALLEKEGNAAFPKFKGKESKFIFAGTYIWIHDEAGMMRMHPIMYKMEGKLLIDLKDSNGKLFFTAMNEIAKTKGAGWVDYMWPKPGEKTPVLKVSYVKMVKVDGENLVVCCGIYDMSPEDVQKVLGK
ncbi:MAG: cache domain-containing protein [Syntrophobacteraceae bacterium]